MNSWLLINIQKNNQTKENSYRFYGGNLIQTLHLRLTILLAVAPSYGLVLKTVSKDYNRLQWDVLVWSSIFTFSIPVV